MHQLQLKQHNLLSLTPVQTPKLRTSKHTATISFSLLQLSSNYCDNV